ncbi:hypothetical protein AWC38_SpisGene12104 [Stylophora pistillata]|uniref:Uncharacterized protein n=1 Tax=Stylophora pistillata TaxID=50429 RepID=A0A2B4S0B5_STYPI|nr:hypothetical protein AWC38_SpisGene12104 [Stylophora pistillata]
MVACWRSVENLQKFLNTFGVQKEKDQKKVSSNRSYRPNQRIDIAKLLFYLARLDENMYAVENPAVTATYFTQDPLLPFQFVEATATGQLETTSILSSVANYKKEDDTIVHDDDDVYYCLLVESLDSGDTGTLTEATEEEPTIKGR